MPSVLTTVLLVLGVTPLLGQSAPPPTTDSARAVAVARDSARVFRLGTVEVTAAATLEIASTATVDAATLRLHNRRDLAEGLALLPGLTVSSIGPRNEAGVYVRGFDLRQVPLFVDGIPVYVPYDGYVDLRRFTTYDAAELRVSKGFSSVLYGPNALGGAINVVSRRPSGPLELSGGTGVFSGDGYEQYLTAGARRNRWYVQAHGSVLNQDAFPLSDDFAPVSTEDGARRENAARRDTRLSAKIALLPRGEDEYVLGVADQRGEKGTPPYAGADPAQLSRARFWKWPAWDKQSAYWMSRTAIGSQSYIRTRAYYDTFDNTLASYDDATYSAQTRPFAFTSIYDDDTWGGSIESGTEMFARNSLRVAAHLKLDTHREHNVGEPVRTNRDQTMSVGAEHGIELTDRLHLTSGLSYERRSTQRADRFESGTISEFPTSASASWAPQVGAFYRAGPGMLQASVARKTRFPTIKDRYSYRLGDAIPNPDLRSEYATHYEVGYVGAVGSRVSLRTSIYLSRIDDLIQRVDNVATGPGDRPLFQLQNVGRAEHRGGEIGVDLARVDRVTGGVTYAFLERRNITNPAIRLIDTPRHHVFSHARVVIIPRVSMLGSVEWSASRFTTSAGDKVSDFAVANITLAVRAASRLSVEAGAQNLLDRNYQLTAGFPEAGRTFFTGLRYTIAGGSE